MRGELSLLNAINGLYAAALARDGWEPVLETVRDALAGHHVVLAMYDVAAGGVPFAASVGVDEQDRARLLSTDALQLASPMYRSVPLDAALPRGALVSDGDFARTAFYNEIVRPMRGFHSVGAIMHGPGGLFSALNICRPEHAGAYDMPDAVALQMILPHVSMALEVQRRLAAGRPDGLERVLDRLATAALIVDANAAPLFVNAAAERLIARGDGLALGATGLAAAGTPRTRALRAAIAGLAAGGDIDGAAGVRLRLERPSGRPALRVTLIPASRLDREGLAATLRGVVLLVNEPDAPPPIDREALADTFHLTRREVEVFVLLSDGLDLRAIAGALGLGRGTVRFHLKNLFQKTGASSQTALVALARGFAGPDLP